ncbi:MAG: MerR family transcriptional regulator [Acidobacteria bacterium]|nr:MerR family transcriptional regulator [Acidobacteriota bacterium]
MGKELSKKEIPDKLYFPIREVAQITGVESYVLRFWEREFPALRPAKGESGHRRYRRKDIEAVLKIKRLLYEQGFTIAGARTQLQKTNRSGEASASSTEKQRGLPFSASPSSALGRIRQGLNEILTILEKT